MAGSVVASLPLPSGGGVYYYPGLNVFSYRRESVFEDSRVEGLQDVVWRLYLFARKVRMLNASMGELRNLTVEPYKTCNLSCKYCYASAGPVKSDHVDPADVVRLSETYHLRRMSVYGGDPLVRKDLLSSYHSNTEWERFWFSTNGVNLDANLVKGLLSRQNVNFQIGIEPAEWMKRVDIKGRPQFQLLGDKLKLLNGLSNFSFRVILSSGVPYVPLKSFLDYLIVEVGHSNFSVTYWTNYAEGEQLVDWYPSWIAESHQLLSDDSKRYLNKVVGHSLSIAVGEMKDNVFHYFNCDAAMTGVQYGFDKRIHACHENAVNEVQSDIISTVENPLRIDNTKKMRIAYLWSNNKNNDYCKGCVARYVCGGCFIRAPPYSVCSFHRETLPLAMACFFVENPQGGSELVEKSQKRLESIVRRRKEYESELAKEELVGFIDGTISVERACSIASEHRVTL